MKKLIYAIIVLVIILTALLWLTPKLQKTVPEPIPTATSTGQVSQPKNFEEALNANDWPEVQKYLADQVYVELEGSECCGQQTASEAVGNLKRVAGIKFTFDETSDSAKAYFSHLSSKDPLNDPSDRIIKPGVRLRDLNLAVEDDPPQPNKAALFYLVENNLVTVILIDKGRDQY
ncbi:MAG: hypothetical protein HYT48_03200 [Candidatus Vogelbacteria bacterium]|nr:hypothetical protein [Candidatus Vogelbacteria bacterium]